MITSEKANTAKNSALQRIGDPYVFAARGEACTPSNRRGYISSDHPTIITDCPVLRGERLSCGNCKWSGAHIYDCRGFTYRVWLDAGIRIEGAGATSQYNTDSNWMAKGTIDSLPECVCCVFKHYDGKMQHTGLYIGGGEIIHCSGTVKRDKIGKAWTHWAIPRGAYTEDQLNNIEVRPIMVTLKKGSTGDAVRELQTQLTQLGYDTKGIDGKYGDNTAAAVRAFQAAQGLTVDGMAGTQTRTRLKELMEQAPTPEPTPDGGKITLTLDVETAKQLLIALIEGGAEA